MWNVITAWLYKQQVEHNNEWITFSKLDCQEIEFGKNAQAGTF